MVSEKGLKIVKFVYWFELKIFLSIEIFCLEFVIKIVMNGAKINGKITFKFGLNISFEAIFDI